MAAKTKNGTNGHNGRISLAREEYEAFKARDESYEILTAQNAKTVIRASDLAQVCDAQAKRMSEFELRSSHQERIIALQNTLIDNLRDEKKILDLKELSDFWQQWKVFTLNEVEKKKTTTAEVAKFEPNLFRMWQSWVNDSGKGNRTLTMSGSRTDIENAEPKSQAMMQTHLLALQREENAKLTKRIAELEAQLGPLQEKQPVEVKQ